MIDCPNCGNETDELPEMQDVYFCEYCGVTSELVVCPVCDCNFLTPLSSVAKCPVCDWEEETNND